MVLKAAASGDYPVDWYYSSSTNAAGGTAEWTSGAAFDAAGSITIIGDGTTDPSGTKGSITINIQSDVHDEWDETFVVNLGTPTNGQKGTAQTYTVTITDASDPQSLDLVHFLLMMELRRQTRRQQILI